MQVIPVQAVSAQTFATVLLGQQVEVTLQQKTTGLFADVALAGQMVLRGRLCRNGAPILRNGVGGFVGDLVFLDMTGSDDPQAEGLGGRFKLMYVGPAE